MDPPPSATAVPTIRSTTSAAKLRLMCSYGGQILPRPHTKSLHYAGGDTRIITIPTATPNLTLSTLTTHLASTLHLNYPFNFKYQLPSHDLDSLISVSTDEDLLIMLDEYHRISPAPSRIRLFLFPTKPAELTQSGHQLKHPKTETWFADVLKSAKIMQKGGVGFGGEGQSEEIAAALCGAESMVLETSSSFGSTSSSASLYNLPSKAQAEDHGVYLVDSKPKLPASDSFPSDNTVASAVSHPQTGIFQVTVENNNYVTSLESERKILDTPNEVVQVAGIPLSSQYDQPQLQFVSEAGPHYLPQNPTAMMPMSSYYLMSSPVPQQPMYYHTNQSPPLYYVSVGHPYNLPMQSGLVTHQLTPATVSANRPPPHPNPSAAQMAYKVAASSPEVYTTRAMPTSHVNLYNENYQQSIGVSYTETANYANEVDDDPLRVQIYKSQPPPPTLPSQYQTMTKATTAVFLSEALAQKTLTSN